MALHQQGQLAAAETLYRAVLERNPGELNALHLLGVLRQQQGRADEAVTLLARVLAAAPGIAVVYSNYGNALKDLGRFDEAADSYRRALAIDPGFADARYNLGRLLKDRGKFAEAADCFEMVLAGETGSAELHNDLGLVLPARRCGRAVPGGPWRGAPDQAVLHCNLGWALLGTGDLVAAEASLRKALSLQPGLPQAALGLGDVFGALDRLDDAVALYRQALPGRARDAVLRNNLGTTLLRLDQVERRRPRWARRWRCGQIWWKRGSITATP